MQRKTDTIRVETPDGPLEVRAGLVIEAVAEPHPDEDTAAKHPSVADARIAPYFLVVRARQSAHVVPGARASGTSP